MLVRLGETHRPICEPSRLRRRRSEDEFCFAIYFTEEKKKEDPENECWMGMTHRGLAEAQARQRSMLFPNDISRYK